ncbi:MAG TPA: hypothetical protein VK585_02350 [Jiangellaceae bacterium]|nr:hypothetical protein [Jiangellaceae bacterium]
MLADPHPAATERVDPDASLVAAYARTRIALPHLVDALSPIADLFRATIR